jgi:hypothetical protein
LKDGGEEKEEEEEEEEGGGGKEGVFNRLRGENGKKCRM